MIFALAVLFAVIGGRKDHAERANADKPVAAPAEVRETADALAAAIVELSRGRPVLDLAPQQSSPADALQKTAAILAKRPGVSERGEQSDFITSAPGHIPASAKAGVTDPALEGLTGGELNAAVQGELLRLGCYDAKVDGKWGRKSQAAVKAFGERAGGEWGDASRQDLVAALRNYPAAFCSGECAARTDGGQCAAAVAPDGRPSVGAGRDKSYLPPWMQGAKLANVEPPKSATLESRDALEDEDAPVLTSKRKKSKSVRRRGGDRGRVAQRHQRRQVSRMQWTPQGWPGAR